MEKSYKMLARDAKARMKAGFWESSRDDLRKQLIKAEENGINVGKVERYYTETLYASLHSSVNEEEELFYRRVKELILREGEVSDAIGRLTDKQYYMTLSFEDRQRYTFNLSERYLKALERFKKECELGLNK